VASSKISASNNLQQNCHICFTNLSYSIGKMPLSQFGGSYKSGELMMQKKLIVVALTAAIALPVQAMADNGNFTFYGKADVSYDIINTGNGTTTANGATAVTGVNKRVVSSNVSKFGFKGSEDLGDGLSAIWQIEQQIDIDAAAKNTFASRNTFAGLKGGFGTVLFGIHDTPYKLATRKLDVFGDSIGDNRALLGGVKSTSAAAAFDGRPTDVLAYISPSFGGVSAAVAMVNLKEANTNDTQANDSALSLAVTYDAAPFYGSVGYESHTLESNITATPTGGDTETATKLGFGYTLDALSIGVVYEKTSDDLAAGKDSKFGHSAGYVGAKYKLGNSAVKLAYGKSTLIGDGAARIDNSDSSQISIGYDHGLSKNTKVYALYSKITNGDGINYGFSQSTAASSSTSGFGTSPSVLSLGLQHNF
jgi:predicted porin